jgi:hypothetical protein
MTRNMCSGPMTPVWRSVVGMTLWPVSASTVCRQCVHPTLVQVCAHITGLLSGAAFDLVPTVSPRQMKPGLRRLKQALVDRDKCAHSAACMRALLLLCMYERCEVPIAASHCVMHEIGFSVCHGNDTSAFAAPFYTHCHVSSNGVSKLRRCIVFIEKYWK